MAEVAILGRFLPVKTIKASELRLGNCFRFPATRPEVYAYVEDEVRNGQHCNAVNVRNGSDTLYVHDFQEVLLVQHENHVRLREARTEHPGSPAAGIVNALFFMGLFWLLIYLFFIR